MDDSIAELSGSLLQALHPNPAVSQDVLKEVYTCLSEEECSVEDVIVRLRQRTVPSGYDYHPWISGNSGVYNIKSLYAHRSS